MPKVKTRTDDRTPFVKLFEAFGVSLSPNGSTQAVADACPFCDGSKFSINVETGLWDCKRGNCGESGNARQFLQWVYDKALEKTTDAHRRTLKKLRGWPLQTTKRFGIAWNDDLGCYLFPLKNPKGDVVNSLRYYPPTQGKKSRKLNLPGLCVGLFGLDQLSNDSERKVFLCEGVFDSISLDQHLRDKRTRERYDILAVPGANIFKKEWARFFQGRTVRICYDNDKAGQDGQQRTAGLLREAGVRDVSVLHWPSVFPGKFDIADLINSGENIVEFTQEHCEKIVATQKSLRFTRGDKIVSTPMRWLWQNRIPLGTFVSFEADIGMQKSTIMRDLAARVTTGKPFPLCKEPAVEAGHVIIFTSEDAGSRVCDLVKLHGGDLEKLHVYDVQESESLNLIERLDDLEDQINRLRCKLVVIDALNSFCSGDISTDSKARRSLTDPLQRLAKRTGATIVGIRNWGREKQGTSSQKALGAISLTHVSRCCFHVVEDESVAMNKALKPGEERRFRLVFERVSDAPLPKPIPFRVKNLSTDDANRHHRRIFWEKGISSEEAKAFVGGLKKGSKKR